jgi:dolichyl-diphosphooligosaccharide--protein glycosyltransferase
VGHKPTSAVTKISFLAIIVALLMVPIVYPVNLNWTNNNAGLPITILNSGSHFNISTNDWPDAMQWLRENTPEDAVIAAWWDYGYWISTLAERKTLADNATLLDWQIRKTAAMYMSTPDHAWHILTSDTETDMSSYYVTLPDNVLYPTRHSDGVYNANEDKLDAFKNWKVLDDVGRTQGQIDKNESRGITTIPGEIYDPDKISNYPTLFDYWEAEVYSFPPIITGLDADYIIINLAAEKLPSENIMDLYTLRQKGGDETKAFWIFKIAELRVLDYYNPELTSYTDKFWGDTLLGKLIPFTPVLYVDPDNSEKQSDTFRPGYTAIYLKDIKFPMDGDGPFQLVYVSPSFELDAPGPMTGPLIYKINKEYNPNQ